MRPLKYIAITATLASAMIFAQSQTNPQAPKTDQNPGQGSRADQVDRPAASADQANKPSADKTTQPSQTQPASSAQADHPSSSSGATYARTYTGSVVSADCAQAGILGSSGSYADRNTSSSSTSTTSADPSASASSKSTTATSSTSSDKDNKSVYDKQREVLKHCRASDKTTTFAVLTDDGSFYKLDEAGNSQVNSQAGSDKEKSKNLKKMRVTVTGSPQGDTLKVQSLTKTDKPFGSA
jgi:hypothetical protein